MPGRLRFAYGVIGVAAGIAGAAGFGSFIGLLADAGIGSDQRIEVRRLVAAVDAGRLVNPGLVRQQIEGGLLHALVGATGAAPEIIAGMPRALEWPHGSAAERDVLENARRRWPAVRFDVRGVAVQGHLAVEQCIAALAALDREPEVDVIVLARGGGSVEDLLPFSDEALCRAVAACRTPVVSAIGHEPDSPLLDAVADVRCSTPTDAGKRVVPDYAEEVTRVRQARDRARRVAVGTVERERARLDALRSRPCLADPHVLLTARQSDVEALQARARRCISAALDRAGHDLDHTRARVVALSPKATLDRGYAVVQDSAGHVVRDPKQVTSGDALRLRLAEGELAATAD